MNLALRDEAVALARVEALELADRLQSYWGLQDDTSADPYDGLSARRVPRAVKGHRWSRLGLVHVHRRCPVNLRRPFGISPTRSPYTSALFASACLRIARAPGPAEARFAAAAAAEQRLQWLAGVRTRGGWAYPFDVQTRTFHYPRTTPNVVCTVFAANAFLDAAELNGDGDWLDLAGDAAHFVVRELLVRGRRSWFRYLPDEDALIHNGNALAAQLLIRYGTLARDFELIRVGRAALEATLAAVGSDGSLVYGEGAQLDWIDGHHTGFVIEALHTVARYRPEAELACVLAPMAAFYRDRLFGPDGWPYQRPDRPYPIDSIAAAQGIQVFAKLGGPYRQTAELIARFAIDRLRRPSGRFTYMRGRGHRKRVPYARWVEAPLALALAVLATEGDTP